MTSLANSAQFPAGVGREINKYMVVWNDDDAKDIDKGTHLISCWNGGGFCTNMGFKTYKHASFYELPSVDENVFVRNGVRYVATDVFAGTGCAKCDLHIGYGCRHPAGQRSCTREGNVYIVWKRAADLTKGDHHG